MNTPLIEISVVIPMKNEARHLHHTIKTIAGFIAQSTPSYELIVIDDGSEDETW